MDGFKTIAILGLALTLPFVLGAGEDPKAKTGKGTEVRAAEITPKTDGVDAGKERQPVAPQTRVQASSDLPVYKPPLRGSPGGRVGGGTRGLSEKGDVNLQVLAPDHVGLTSVDQPRLYWYLAPPVAHPVEFTLIERGAVKPLVETRLKIAGQSGIQCIRLADYGVRLNPNVPYKWYVSVVFDPDRRSRDAVAGGVVEYVGASPDLSAKLKDAGSEKAPHVLAGEGFWYDAFALVSDRIDASPGRAEYQNQRAALLEQVGIMDVSASGR